MKRLFALALLFVLTMPCAAQTLRERQERVALAYEARAQAWVARAVALQANAEAFQAKAQAWEQSIIVTMAWPDFGETDSTFVSDAQKATLHAREEALKGRETALRSQELALDAREAALRSRQLISFARETALRSQELALDAREAASFMREAASVAWSAASDARELASRAEGKMIRARTNAIGQYATLWERGAAEAGGEHTMWIRAEEAYDTVEEAFNAAAEALDAEAAAWEHVEGWISADSRARGWEDFSRRKDEWKWGMSSQYSTGRFSFFGDIPAYFPLGFAITIERVNKPLAFFVPLYFHYIEKFPKESGLRGIMDWSTHSFIGFGTRYYVSNVYISISIGGEMSGNEYEALAGRWGSNNWVNKFAFALQGNMGYKIPFGKNSALDLSLDIRELRSASYSPERGFMLSIGISTF